MAKAIRLTKNEDGSVTASYADGTTARSAATKRTVSSAENEADHSGGTQRVMVRNGYTVTATPTRTGYASPSYDHQEAYTDAYGNISYYPADREGNSTGPWHSNLVVPDYSKKAANQSYASYFGDLNFGYDKEYEDEYVYYRPASMVPTITIRKNGSGASDESESSGRTSARIDQGGGTLALQGNGYSHHSGGYESYLSARNALIDAQIETILSQVNAGKGTVNQLAGDAARQAYINMKTTENALPQTLSASGRSGGAAQSALLDLYTSYERSRNDIERDRNSQLAQIEDTAALARAEGSVQKAQAALEYQKQALEQAYQRELLEQKAQQQAALERQKYEQQLGLLAAKSTGGSAQSTAAAGDGVDGELAMLEAQEALSLSGDVDAWLREYQEYLSPAQLDAVLERYWRR